MSKSASINNLPQHVAIIMDGNGRWAKKHHLPRIEGHKQGALNARNSVEWIEGYNIPYLTLYTFSTENWNRPKSEVDGLFGLLEERLDEGVRLAVEKGIKFRHLGKLDNLPARIQEKIKETTELTRNNHRFTLCLAFNYGGRDEIVEAAQAIVRQGINAKDVDQSVISRNLYTAGLPDPDLIIRTGGEMRLSNFLLWQAAYSEIYCTAVLWPDFNKEDVDKALAVYGKRQRRYGKIIS
jgi:undecaprenyl diphosphate synthase